MRRPTPVAMLSVLILIVAACGTGSGAEVPFTQTSAVASVPPPSGPADASPPGTIPAGAELRLIVLPDEDGHMPANVEIGCPGGPWFPASALDGIFPLEGSGLDHIEDAVRPFLESGEGAFWPQEDWLVLHESEDSVVLVHAGADLAFQGVELEGGVWKWAGSSATGECPLRTRVAAGMNTVAWRFDVEAPTASSTSFTVLVNERECVSGKAIGDRLLGPEIVMTEETVYIAFAATPPAEPEQTCPGNPEQPVNIDLGEPLGDRTIEDGLALAGDLRDFLP